MVTRAGDWDTGIDDALDCICERAAVGIANRGGEEAGRARWRRRAALRLPRVQPEVVVVAARGDEGRLLAVAMLELEAEHAAVEVERAVDVGDLQVHVPDVHARIDRASVHAAIVLREPELRHVRYT